MTSTHWLRSLVAVATVIAGTASVARPNAALREVPNRSLPTQAGYGWKYFSDPRAARAVMITPLGEYYLSLGDGPRQVTWLEGQGAPTPPTHN